MHRMYKVITDSGVYAVKHLNVEIMKRPGVHENYARAEKIEGILENNDIPIVPAMVIGGSKMQKIGDQFFYVFRWQKGSIDFIINQLEMFELISTSLDFMGFPRNREALFEILHHFYRSLFFITLLFEHRKKCVYVVIYKEKTNILCSLDIM